MIHGSLIIIVLYVDEIPITRSSKKEIASLKSAMNHAFSMTDLGLLSQFLGAWYFSIISWNQGKSDQVLLISTKYVYN